MGQPVKILHYKSGLADMCAGVEQFILNLYANMDKGEYSFSLLTRNAGSDSGVADVFKENGIDVFDLELEHLGIKTMPVFAAKLEKFFSAHENEFAFLHMHGCEDPFVIETAKRHGVKTVGVHVHQMAVQGGGLGSKVKQVTAQANMKSADFLFACSIPAGKSYFGSRSFTVLGNGIQTGKFTFDKNFRNEIRREFSIGQNEKAVCYTGRFEAVKNLFFTADVFCSLAEKHPEYRFFFIGDGEQRKELEEYITSKNLREKTVFTGTRYDINKLLCGMDAYVQTSINEGFSISALEAQCSGLPVFISDGFPDEVMLTDSSFKISLSEPSEKWAETVFEKINICLKNDRAEYSRIIAEKGYDAEKTGKLAGEFYGCKKN